MRKLLVILLFVAGAVVFGSGNAASSSEGVVTNISDLHHEQLLCAHRYTIDAEPAMSVVVPSVRTTTTISARTSLHRLFTQLSTERYNTTTNYSVARFVHRLGSCSRAVDYYLYMLCVLRL